LIDTSIFNKSVFFAEGTLMKHVFALSILFLYIFIAPFCYTADESDEGHAELDIEIRKGWFGDYDEMKKDKVIRVLVVPSRTGYFLDGATQRGATYEALKEFEKHINKNIKKKTDFIHVAIVPVRRDQLVSGLVEGMGDIAASSLTITPERAKLVDFSDPVTKSINEIVVTGPNSPEVNSLDDLQGQEIVVRESSSYYEHLVKLNEQFKKDGKQPIVITPADEILEDDDLLEMVNSGLLPMVVADDYLAKFWAQVLPNLQLHPNIAINKDGYIAWMIRKNCPQLMKVVNEFVKMNKQGTLIGNIIMKRYYKNTQYVKNVMSDEERKKFDATIELFKKYASMYRFDWLMVAAQAYQESQLDHSRRSHVGAIGIMQLMPTTAKDPNVNIPDITNLENNIHAGTKYLRFVANQYFNDEKIDELNKWLFAFASYNAGPTRVSRLRHEATKMGLDPNKWFMNVEYVIARKVGREPVQYVRNIYKYYIAYKRIVENYRIYKETKSKLTNEN
jgi:membrane-bound lytic murein transglycosylase MltF